MLKSQLQDADIVKGMLCQACLQDDNQTTFKMLVF